MKTISVSDNLHKYLLDHKDSNKKSIEAVIFSLIGKNDELKKALLAVKAFHKAEEVTPKDFDELMFKIQEALKNDSVL